MLGADRCVRDEIMYYVEIFNRSQVVSCVKLLLKTMLMCAVG